MSIGSSADLYELMSGEVTRAHDRQTLPRSCLTLTSSDLVFCVDLSIVLPRADGYVRFGGTRRSWCVASTIDVEQEVIGVRAEAVYELSKMAAWTAEARRAARDGTWWLR